MVNAGTGGVRSELTIESLSLSFGGLAVLSDVSFEASRGELLALIGPNGAGKTSVLNCISGLYRGSAGKVFIGERDITGEKPHRIAAIGVARTFQHGELFPHMTVVENLLVARHARLQTRFVQEMLFSATARKAEVDHRGRIEEILEFVELERYRHRDVDTLPFGLQKIVGFARALAMEPRVLLLDEPSSGLNREEREDLARHILRIRHQFPIAMVWVEHDMQMVADLADRVCVLDSGRRIAYGPPAQVLRDPRVIEVYVGD